MLELLNSNIETVDMNLNPLNRYFIHTCIKIEYQSKHRKAAWFVGVEDYIRQKEFYDQDAEILIELRKAYTD